MWKFGNIKNTKLLLNKNKKYTCHNDITMISKWTVSEYVY